MQVVYDGPTCPDFGLLRDYLATKDLSVLQMITYALARAKAADEQRQSMLRESESVGRSSSKRSRDEDTEQTQAAKRRRLRMALVPLASNAKEENSFRRTFRVAPDTGLGPRYRLTYEKVSIKEEPAEDVDMLDGDLSTPGLTYPVTTVTESFTTLGSQKTVSSQQDTQPRAERRATEQPVAGPSTLPVKRTAIHPPPPLEIPLAVDRNEGDHLSPEPASIPAPTHTHASKAKALKDTAQLRRPEPAQPKAKAMPPRPKAPKMAARSVQTEAANPQPRGRKVAPGDAGAQATRHSDIVKVAQPPPPLRKSTRVATALDQPLANIPAPKLKPKVVTSALHVTIAAAAKPITGPKGGATKAMVDGGDLAGTKRTGVRNNIGGVGINTKKRGQDRAELEDEGDEGRRHSKRQRGVAADVIAEPVRVPEPASALSVVTNGYKNVQGSRRSTRQRKAAPPPIPQLVVSLPSASKPRPQPRPQPQSLKRGRDGGDGDEVVVPAKRTRSTKADGSAKKSRQGAAKMKAKEESDAMDIDDDGVLEKKGVRSRRVPRPMPTGNRPRTRAAGKARA